MRKKWTTSSRKPKDLTPEQQKEVLAPNLITSLFNTITKLDRNELDKFIANMKNRQNSEMISTDVILKQKLWGLSIGHVLVNRGDDEICSCSEGKDVMIEKVNEMLIYLMDMGLDLNVEERKNKILPIHLAAERCSYSFKWIMTMIEKGNQSATTCCGSELGFTPLDYAISNNRLELVTHMLDCETVDFGEFSYSNHHNEENRRRLLPFHVASQSGNVGILEFLINHACKYYVNNNPKLEQLVEFTNSSISSISLNEFTKQFLSIKTQDVNAQTALHLAVREGHISCVKLLLEKGADPLLSDQNDKTVIDYARINFINRHAIIEELQKYVNFEILPPPEPICIIPISTIQPEISNVGEAENVNQELEELRSESSNEDEEENENIYFM